MAPGRRTRILIVDDSAVMRSLLRSVVSADPALEVAGTAADGASALSTLASLSPDLILLDVEMPVMDGLLTLRELRRRGHKMPVIMCSAVTQRGAKVTLEALASGASDYVAKPSGQANREAATRALSQDLGPKIHALTCQYPSPLPGPLPGSQQGPQLSGVFPGLPQRSPLVPALAPFLRQQAISISPAVLAIGVSTGGPAALDALLPLLPANFPLPVLIVQHMPELFTRIFAERLNGRCKLRVREAAEGEPVCPGTIAIARGNWHMEVLAAARIGAPPTLHLTQGPLENHCRPAVDVLFRSVAAVYGKGALAVVLTGMGSDGLLGCRIVREHGGAVLAQDQASSTVWGMPGAVTNAGLAHKVLALNDIAPEILRLVSRTRSEARELRESVV
ncbi:MAG: chemotaxis response regulator protein-glutamate methylesterase [Terracidiphilus sp.]|jgi:two-component system, chemotaxis family, protein-glutamate methylesterase/glutaminase|nr:chemotaxis response regulator protein-glutamate methylesterase [Terracidiphilus sp.]